MAYVQHIHNWQQSLEYYNIIAVTVMKRNEVVMINFHIKL